MSNHYKSNTLIVSGEETILAAPDQAIIKLGVITENKDPAAAQQENANTISNVINAIIGSGLPKEHIRTVEYRIEPQYEYQESTQIFRGYKVTHLLQLTISGIKQVGDILDTAVRNGANTVSSLRFTLSNLEGYYNQALSLALENAREKAAALAKTLGVTLNKTPDLVQEVSVNQPILFESATLLKNAQTPIQPGELEIPAAVKVEYSYFN